MLWYFHMENQVFMELFWEVSSALWHTAKGTHEKWMDTDPWLTSLVLVSQSVCMLILGICDTSGSYLLAGHQYKNVPEVSGITPIDGLYLLTAHLPNRRLVGLVRAGTSLYLTSDRATSHGNGDTALTR